MFAHQIVEDLKKRSPNYINKDRQLWARASIELLQTSHKFHMGSFNDLFKMCNSLTKTGSHLFDTGFEHLHFPYKISYFDGVPDFENSPFTKSAMLVWESERDPAFFVYVSFMHHPDEFYWFLNPILLIIHIGGDLPHDEFSKRARIAFPEVLGNSSATESRHSDSAWHMMIPLDDSITTFEQMCQLRDQENANLSALHSFVVMMNCKNVSTNTIHAPEKLNRKRISSKKQPLFSYHILKVDIPGERKVTKNVGEKEALNHYRKHFCRGHVRRYTSEKPLLGRYVGPVWIPAHLRGSEDGFVDKDYKAVIVK